MQILVIGITAIAIVFTVVADSPSDSIGSSLVLDLCEKLPSATYAETNHTVHLFSFLATLGISGAIFSYIIATGILSGLRYHYMRRLEDKIRSFAGNEYFGWNEISAPISTLNYRHVRNGFSAMHFASLLLAIVFAIVTLVVFEVYLTSGLSALEIGIPVLVMLPFWAFFIAAIVLSCSNSRLMFNIALKDMRKRRYCSADLSIGPASCVEVELGSLNDGDGAKSRGASKSESGDRCLDLALYLIYPRPQDAMKLLFICFGVLMGSLASMSGDFDLGKFAMQCVVAVVIFDFCGYQARYQWNDILGYHEDANNPEAARRRRLPHCSESEWIPKLASGIVALYRITFGAFLLLWAPIESRVWFGVSYALIFGLAALYEFARSREAAALEADRNSKRWAQAVFALVGFGYPLRVVAGLLVSHPLDPALLLADPIQSLSLVLMVVAAIPFGYVFVGITWALEGVDHREQHVDDPRPYHKAHVELMAAKLGDVGGRGKPFLPSSKWSIWDSMMLASVLMLVAAAWLSVIVWSGWASSGLPEVVFLALVSLLLVMWFLSMIACPDRSKGFKGILDALPWLNDRKDALNTDADERKKPRIALGHLDLLGAVLIAVLVLVGIGLRCENLAPLACLECAVFLLVYCGFKGTNYKEMAAAPERIIQGVKAACYKALCSMLAISPDGKK